MGLLLALVTLFPGGLPWAPTEEGCVASVDRCVWDARHQGNGKGQSLVLVRRGDEYIGKVITHRRARRLQARWCSQPDVACMG